MGILLFLLILSASQVNAATFVTPGGAVVEVEGTNYTWVEKVFTLPSGFIWKELIKVAKAYDIWESYEPLKRACSCESWWSPNGEPRQFNFDGSVLWGQDKTGKIVKRDVGACQINTIAHAKELKRLDLDVINSFEDNVAFAKILFDRAGLKPWEPSRVCWK